MTVNIERPDKLTNGCKEVKTPDPRNWQFGALRVCKAATKQKLPKKCNIKNKFGLVYMQRYGNCTTNAALACDAYYYHDPKGTWMPSTTFTYYIQRAMVGEEDIDEGSIILYALKAIKKYGVCNSKVWPNDKPFNKKPSKKAYADGLKGKEITKYYQVKSFLQVKKAISLKYPVAMSMRWPFKTADSETWILNTPTKEEYNNCRSCHAIVIVGYDDEKKLVEIRNSWGENWCNKGYAYMTYEAFKLCAGYGDAYAIVK